MLSCDGVSARESRFVVGLHDATTLHFDLRLELDGVARSWAVPKGPSLDPAVKRLAVPVADHGLDALDFEGVHAGATRGTGAVIVWDEGTFTLRSEREGHLSFVLHGHKLEGAFALTRTSEKAWILVKMRDEAALPGFDVVAEEPRSVRSGRTWQEVARGEPPRA
jgi:DNA ligase D-like protein (predicted 3'-phosphoesterase)